MKMKICALTSALIMASNLTTVFAEYKPVEAPTQTGYFEFYEDFSEAEDGDYDKYYYTAEDTDTAYNLAYGEKAIVNRDDGVVWKTSGTYFSSDSGGAKNRACVQKGYLSLRGSGANVAKVNLDLGENLLIKDIVKEKQEFSFKILSSSARTAAVSLFNSENEGANYINFGYATDEAINGCGNLPKNRPYVSFGGVTTKVIYPKSTMSISYPVTYTVSIDDDVISWTVKDNGGRTWSDSTSFDKQYVEECEYLAAFAVAGDGWARLNEFKYQTGVSYSKELGAPKEAVYVDLTENSEISDGICKLNKPSVIHRVEYSNYGGTSFEMSADGENYTAYDRNDTEGIGIWSEKTPDTTPTVANPIKYRWINTGEKDEISYIKLPSDEVIQRKVGKGVFKAFTDVSKKQTIEIEKGKGIFIYLWNENDFNTDFSITTDDEDYLKINDSEAYLALGRIQLKAKKETYTTGKKQIVVHGNSDYVINLKITGPLSRTMEKLTDPSMTDAEKAKAEADYVQNQMLALTALNNLITAVNDNPDDVDSYTALKAFFTDDSVEYGINYLDFIEGRKYKNVDDAFISRILTYKDNYFKASSINELENISDLFETELNVGDFSDLSSVLILTKKDGKEYYMTNIQALDEDGDPMFDDEGEKIYYTGDEYIASIIEKNKDSLPVENKYYKSEDYAEAIRLNLASNPNFKNYYDLCDRINRAIVIEVLKINKNPEMIADVLKDYEETIGYTCGTDDAKLHKLIEDKQNTKALVQSMSAKYSKDEDAFDTVEKIKDFIDKYEPPKEEEKKSNKSSGSSGGGGGGGTDNKTRPIVADVSEKNNVPVKIFDDVETDFWGYEAVKYLNAVGAVNGYENGLFMPNGNITRAEFVSILINSIKNNITVDETTENPFVDVSTEDWFCNVMIKAYVAGVVLGDNDNNANPTKQISREEMAVMISRMISYVDKTIETDHDVIKFEDESDIADWARTSVLKMSAMGIVKGSNGVFMPKSYATRAEAAQMIYNTAISE